jgi:glycerol uptake facilitator-like aquaporin
MLYDIKKYIVEFFGTLLLTFVILVTDNYLAYGATEALICYFGQPISGAAYNPAIALAFLANKEISNLEIIPYIIFEIIGAICGYFLYKLIK